MIRFKTSNSIASWYGTTKMSIDTFTNKPAYICYVANCIRCYHKVMIEPTDVHKIDSNVKDSNMFVNVWSVICSVCCKQKRLNSNRFVPRLTYESTISIIKGCIPFTAANITIPCYGVVMVMDKFMDMMPDGIVITSLSGMKSENECRSFCGTENTDDNTNGLSYEDDDYHIITSDDVNMMMI